MRLFIVGLLLFFLANPCTLWASGLIEMASTADRVAIGTKLFQRHCSGCHGKEAKGDGPASIMLNPKPRNLVDGAFKFRSTPYGVLPSTQDLVRTITQGIRGSSMPAFDMLRDDERIALAAFIQSLRPGWNIEESDRQVMPLTSKPAGMFETKQGLIAAASRGQKHYTEGCAVCHGPEGLGNGESAEGLLSEQGEAMRPANLTLPHTKSGRRPEDVYRALTTGLEGTPMPSYVDSFTDIQRWELAAFVFYLRGKAAGIYSDADRLEGP